MKVISDLNDAHSLILRRLPLYHVGIAMCSCKWFQEARATVYRDITHDLLWGKHVVQPPVGVALVNDIVERTMETTPNYDLEKDEVTTPQPRFKPEYGPKWNLCGGGQEVKEQGPQDRPEHLSRGWDLAAYGGIATASSIYHENEMMPDGLLNGFRPEIALKPFREGLPFPDLFHGDQYVANPHQKCPHWFMVTLPGLCNEKCNFNGNGRIPGAPEHSSCADPTGGSHNIVCVGPDAPYPKTDQIELIHVVDAVVIAWHEPSSATHFSIEVDYGDGNWFSVCQVENHVAYEPNWANPPGDVSVTHINIEPVSCQRIRIFVTGLSHEMGWLAIRSFRAFGRSSVVPTANMTATHHMELCQIMVAQLTCEPWLSRQVVQERKLHKYLGWRYDTPDYERYIMALWNRDDEGFLGSSAALGEYDDDDDDDFGGLDSDDEAYHLAILDEMMHNDDFDGGPDFFDDPDDMDGGGYSDGY